LKLLFVVYSLLFGVLTFVVWGLGLNAQDFKTMVLILLTINENQKKELGDFIFKFLLLT
jgi:hypothetical protein